jgi:hypothetical protein
MKLAVLLLPAALLAPVLVATPASAASAVMIGKTQYDSPGSDNRSAASLNAEYVTLKNVTRTAKALRGWTLRDAQNHVYTLPAFTLGAGKSVIIHTGKGTNSAAHLYWKQTNYVWNNGGDKATLKTPAGAVADSCAWTATGKGVTAC